MSICWYLYGFLCGVMTHYVWSLSIPPMVSLGVILGILCASALLVYALAPEE